MTHLLVPLEEFHRLLERSKDLETVMTLGALELKSKYISLDEKDIVEKAEQFAKDHSIYPSGEDDTAYGYREALKQLI